MTKAQAEQLERIKVRYFVPGQAKKIIILKPFARVMIEGPNDRSPTKTSQRVGCSLVLQFDT